MKGHINKQLCAQILCTIFSVPLYGEELGVRETIRTILNMENSAIYSNPPTGTHRNISHTEASAGQNLSQACVLKDTKDDPAVADPLRNNLTSNSYSIAASHLIKSDKDVRAILRNVSNSSGKVWEESIRNVLKIFSEKIVPLTSLIFMENMKFDPIWPSEYLDYLRLNASGTYLEEAALRLQISLLIKSNEDHRTIALTRRYVARFHNTDFARPFIERLTRLISENIDQNSTKNPTFYIQYIVVISVIDSRDALYRIPTALVMSGNVDALSELLESCRSNPICESMMSSRENLLSEYLRAMGKGLKESPNVAFSCKQDLQYNIISKIIDAIPRQDTKEVTGPEVVSMNKMYEKSQHVAAPEKVATELRRRTKRLTETRNGFSS